jgi:ATP-dependent RNA helicase DeaD
MSFKNLGLKKEILDSIEKMGFKEPSPIQEKAIPVVLAGKDLIAQAHTGTGKTAAFGLPVLNNLSTKNEVQVLVMTPTRELANQVSDELYNFGKNLGIKTVTVYGGSSYKRQIDHIKRGAQIVVATPGRMLDLLKGKKIKDFAPSVVILDEADEMLDMGFSDDIHEIISYTPKKRQTLLFSATMSDKIKNLSRNILFDPEHISLVDNDARRVNDSIEELYCVIEENERDDAVFRLLDAEDFDKVVIFCRTKREVDRLSSLMMGRGYVAQALHGDIDQRKREKVLDSFKNKDVEVLVATDVAARGMDVEEITHVINFHIPFDSDSYVHRIGRTGRAGKSGKAITLVTPRENRDLRKIRKDVGERMSYVELPSKGTLASGKLDSLMDSLRSQKVSKEAVEFAKQYGAEMDLEEMFMRLVSLNLVSDEFSVDGPDKIGVYGEKLSRFISDLDKKGGGRSGRSRHRRRRRGGRNRSGGGRRGGGSRGHRKGGNSGRGRGSRGNK